MAVNRQELIAAGKLYLLPYQDAPNDYPDAIMVRDLLHALAAADTELVALREKVARARAEAEKLFLDAHRLAAPGMMVGIRGRAVAIVGFLEGENQIANMVSAHVALDGGSRSDASGGKDG